MPFPITCAACQKTFSIADDVYERKVKGRVVTIKCKQCHAGIRVDGTKETPVFSLADPPPVAAAAPAPLASEHELRSEPATTQVAAKEVPTPAAVAAEPPAAATKAAPTDAAPATETTTAPEAAKAASPAAAAPKATTAAAVTPAVLATKAAPVAAAATKAAAVVAPKAATAPAAKPVAAATPKATPAPVTKAQPVGVKPPPAAPAVKAAPAPVAAAAKAPVVTATPKAPPVGVRPPPTAPALKAHPPAAPDGVPAAPPAETLWAVDYPDGEDRELTRQEIQKALASGAINTTTLVWREGMAEWLELGQVAELQPVAEAVKPAPAPAQRPKAASAPALDLPAQRPKAASAPALDLPPQRAKSAPTFELPELSATLPQAPTGLAATPQLQRPPAPSAPVIDFASAPRAAPGAPAPIPKLPVAAGTPPSFPALPGALPVLANPFSGNSAAPAFATNPVPFAGVSPVTGLDEYPTKSKTPLIVGGVALLAVAAAGIFFLTRSTDELPPPAPISALPATAPTTQHPAAPEPGALQDAEGSRQTAPARGPNAALQAPGGPPQTTPNAGFAELFANGARGADERQGVTGPTQRFDPAAAKAALASAAVSTAQCREKGGPVGKASVVVTFEPSGKVSTATVSDAPFAGTSSGACIAAALKKATIPAFSGLPGSVTKIISIQ